MNDDLRSNALYDLLDAEKHFRQQAENALRELRSVLAELAQRLGGTQLENCRRADPLAPENWGPEQWRRFFAGLTIAAPGERWALKESAELKQLQKENRELAEKLQVVHRELAELHARNVEPSSPSTTVMIEDGPEIAPGKPDVPEEHGQPEAAEVRKPSSAHPFVGYAHSELLRDLRALVIPRSVPMRFEGRFPRIGLKDADWSKQVRRKMYVLYLLSRGLDIRLEIDHLISQVEGISSRTGALRRVYDGMAEKNLISTDVMEMSAPNTSLAMLRLTDDGRELCRILSWEPVQTERERMNQLHEGLQYPQHTLGVLIFVMHARFRGFRAGVLPAIEKGKTAAVPDAWIESVAPENLPTPLYVEVEMSNKELPEKWRNLTQLQGRVALCARSVQRRARLVGDCKLKNLPGLATDLETLIAPKVPEITYATPLWIDEW
jgi:hypothetical protein